MMRKRGSKNKKSSLVDEKSFIKETMALPSSSNNTDDDDDMDAVGVTAGDHLPSEAAAPSSSSSSSSPGSANNGNGSDNNNGDMNALISKNHKLAKELSEVRIRHREECKNVTRLTKENMNLASRCREVISQAASFKKELSQQKRKTAEAVKQTHQLLDQIRKMKKQELENSKNIINTSSTGMSEQQQVVAQPPPERSLSVASTDDISNNSDPVSSSSTSSSSGTTPEQQDHKEVVSSSSAAAAASAMVVEESISPIYSKSNQQNKTPTTIVTTTTAATVSPVVAEPSPLTTEQKAGGGKLSDKDASTAAVVSDVDQDAAADDIVSLGDDDGGGNNDVEQEDTFKKLEADRDDSEHKEDADMNLEAMATRMAHGVVVPTSGLVSSDDYEESFLLDSPDSKGSAASKPSSQADGDVVSEKPRQSTTKESSPTPANVTPIEGDVAEEKKEPELALAAIEKVNTGDSADAAAKNVSNASKEGSKTASKELSEIAAKKDIAPEKAASKEAQKAASKDESKSARKMSSQEGSAGSSKNDSAVHVGENEAEAESEETADTIMGLKESPTKRGFFPYSASPKIPKILRASGSYDDEFPPDMIQQPMLLGKSKLRLEKFVESSEENENSASSLNGGRSSNLLTSIDAFEASFNTNFPDSFSPKDDATASSDSKVLCDDVPQDTSLYDPFAASPTKEPKKEFSTTSIPKKESPRESVESKKHTMNDHAFHRGRYNKGADPPGSGESPRRNLRGTTKTSRRSNDPKAPNSVAKESAATPPVPTLKSTSGSASSSSTAAVAAPPTSSAADRYMKQIAPSSPSKQTPSASPSKIKVLSNSSPNTANSPLSLGSSNSQPRVSPSKTLGHVEKKIDLDRFSTPISPQNNRRKPEPAKTGYEAARARYETAMATKRRDRRSLGKATNESPINATSVGSDKGEKISPDSLSVRDRAARFSGSPTSGSRTAWRSPTRFDEDEGDIPLRTSLSPQKKKRDVRVEAPLDAPSLKSWRQKELSSGTESSGRPKAVLLDDDNDVSGRYRNSVSNGRQRRNVNLSNTKNIHTGQTRRTTTVGYNQREV